MLVSYDTVEMKAIIGLIAVIIASASANPVPQFGLGGPLGCPSQVPPDMYVFAYPAFMSENEIHLCFRDACRCQRDDLTDQKIEPLCGMAKGLVIGGPNVCTLITRDSLTYS